VKFGIWTPLPHTIRHDDALTAAIAEATRVGPVDGPDKALEIAAETLQTGEALGFVTTLIAARHSGPDLDAWLLASALATRTSAIELIVAQPGGRQRHWKRPRRQLPNRGATAGRLRGGRFRTGASALLSDDRRHARFHGKRRAADEEPRARGFLNGFTQRPGRCAKSAISPATSAGFSRKVKERATDRAARAAYALNDEGLAAKPHVYRDHLSRTGTSVRSGTARLGERSREILAGAAFATDEIAAMIAAGVIGEPR